MNKKFLIPVLTLILITLQSCKRNEVAGYYKGYELPPYKVTKQINDFEFREYEPNLIAEVEVEGARKEAAKKGFRILAGYIFGKNSAQKKVDMTSPVTQESSEKIAMTSPVTQVSEGEKPGGGKKWHVQFGMPKNYSLETLPKAKDERIKFRYTKARKVVALVFAGSWSDEKFLQKKKELAEFVVKKSLKTKGESFLAYYDDPFTFPWNRRNEVIQEIE